MTPETGYFLDKARKPLGDAEIMLGVGLHDAAGRSAISRDFTPPKRSFPSAQGGQ
jgi:hypothetical protein